MSELELGRRLAALTPPDPAAARRRAARDTVRRLARERRPRRAVRARLAIPAVAALAAILAFSLTPPGQAAAEWAAQRLGIGEPGGPPSQAEFREFVFAGSSAEPRAAVVIARGTVAATGGHYEIVTWRDDDRRCFETMLVDPAGAYAPGCAGLAAVGGLTIDAMGGNLAPGQELQFVAGRAGAGVADVRVEFRGNPVPTQVTAIDPELIASHHLDPGLITYFSELPDFISGGLVEVTALDAADEVVGRTSRRLPDLTAFRRARPLRPPPR